MSKPGRPKRILSEEEIQTIVTMAQTGMGCNKIGRVLHTDTNKVNDVMKQYGLRGTNKPGRPHKNKTNNE